MKPTLLAVFFALLLLAGCSDSGPEYPGGSDIGKTIEICKDALAMEHGIGGGPITTDKVNGIDHYYFGGEPYTGWVKFNLDNNEDEAPGCPSIIFHVEEGKHHGAYVRHNKSNMIEKGQYVHGVKDGEWTKWTSDGVTYDYNAQETTVYDMGKVVD